MRGYLLFIGVAMFFSLELQAQEELKFGDTPTTSTDKPTYQSDPGKYKDRHKIQWVKNNSKGLLLGNPCMEDVIDDMGFVYLVQPKGRPYNRSEFGRNVHNFFAKIGILFRNGPFWKFKLKKWRKRCLAESGDFVG